MSASAIHRALGEKAPAVADIIKRLSGDDRFARNEEKCWSLAKEEAPEERERAA